jgi:hypothetical protein
MTRSVTATSFTATDPVLNILFIRQFWLGSKVQWSDYNRPAALRRFYEFVGDEDDPSLFVPVTQCDF